jgi:hypothetical protein
MGLKEKINDETQDVLNEFHALVSAGAVTDEDEAEAITYDMPLIRGYRRLIKRIRKREHGAGAGGGAGGDGDASE